MNTKIVLNIIGLIVLIALITLLVIDLVNKPNFKLENDNLLIYSNYDITPKIKELQDTNNILILLDSSNYEINPGNLILFVQLYSAKHRNLEFIIIEDNNCLYNNLINKTQTKTTKDNCYQLLEEKNYPKIIINNLNLKLTKPEIEIKNYDYYITLSNNTEDSEKILKFIFADYDEISNKISNYTNNFVNSQN